MFSCGIFKLRTYLFLVSPVVNVQFNFKDLILQKYFGLFFWVRGVFFPVLEWLTVLLRETEKIDSSGLLQWAEFSGKLQESKKM